MTSEPVKRESYFSRFRKRWKRRGVIEIDVAHPKYDFTFLIRQGLQRSIEACQQNEKSSDVGISRKFSQSLTGEHDKTNFEFVTYAPRYFELLRDQVGFASDQYKDCICPSSPEMKYLEFVSNSKSGQNFFLSNNKQLMIKTITRNEKRFFFSILDKYKEHLQKYPHTLLVRYLGLYKISLKRQEPVFFIVMQSILYPDERIDLRYDLKACAAGRFTKEKTNSSNAITILKDVNFGSRTLHLGPQSGWFNLQIEHDTAFLQKLRVIDYSLLVGVQTLHSDEIDENNDLAAIVCRAQKSTSRNHSVRRGWLQTPSNTMTVIEENQSNFALDQSSGVDLPGTVQQVSDKSMYYDSGGARSTVVQTSISSHSFSQHSSLTESESLTQNRRLLPQCRNELHTIDGTNKERYFVGIIDFLTTYGFKKRFESLYKGIKYKKSGLTFSTVNPDLYGQRFREFICSHVS